MLFSLFFERSKTQIDLKVWVQIIVFHYVPHAGMFKEIANFCAFSYSSGHCTHHLCYVLAGLPVNFIRLLRSYLWEEWSITQEDEKRTNRSGLNTLERCRSPLDLNFSLAVLVVLIPTAWATVRNNPATDLNLQYG